MTIEGSPRGLCIETGSFEPNIVSAGFRAEPTPNDRQPRGAAARTEPDTGYCDLSLRAQRAGKEIKARCTIGGHEHDGRDHARPRSYLVHGAALKAKPANLCNSGLWQSLSGQAFTAPLGD
jgi:hypothetical protein